VPEIQDFKPGDIVGFSGRCWWSAAINFFTGGIPFWGLSHVGILANSQDGRLLFWESTDESALPCEITGNEKVAGVQAHSLDKVLAGYHGRAWLYSLYRHLYAHEKCRLTGFLMSLVGRSYDTPGAIRSGGMILAVVDGCVRDESLDLLFCSEAVAAAAANIGIFQTANASRWSPNRLVRRLRLSGIVRKPKRLK